MRFIKPSLLLPLIYAIICIAAWISFATKNHDGLANLGLGIVTLPSSLIERAIAYQIYGHYENLPFWEPILRKIGFPTGYLWNHAYWFMPLVFIQAGCLFLVGKGLEKWINRSKIDKSRL